VEQEHKQEDVRVSMVTLVVKPALDHLPKHDLVVQRLSTQNGVRTEHGVRVLYHVELEYRREHVLVSGVILVVTHVLETRTRRDLVEKHQLTQDGVGMEHGVRAL